MDESVIFAGGLDELVNTGGFQTTFGSQKNQGLVAGYQHPHELDFRR